MFGREIAAKPWKLGNTRFTANWTVFCSPFQFQTVRTSELLWVYRSSTIRWAHGIPVGQDHHFVLCDRHGVKLTVPPGAGSTAKKLVAAFQKMAPWVAVGNSLKNQWKWKRRRKQMAADADAIKASLTAPPAPPLAA